MTITKRGTKGSALTYNEMDENIRDLYEDTTINRVFTNASGSGSDIQHLTYSAPSQGALNSHTDPGYITINYNTRLRMANVNSNGDSWCCANMLDMKNHNIVGVNHLAFADAGPSEGLLWENIRIFESPNDLTTNEPSGAGSLQIVHKNTGTPAGGSPIESYERRLTVANDHTEIRGQIQADSHQYVLVVSGEDKHNTINQTTNSGVGIKIQLANNSADGESFTGAGIVAKRENEQDANSSTALEFYTSDNDETLDKKVTVNTNGIDVVGTIKNEHFTIPNSAGAAGQVLKWPSSGSVLEWANDNSGGGGSSSYKKGEVIEYLTGLGDGRTLSAEADSSGNSRDVTMDTANQTQYGQSVSSHSFSGYQTVSGTEFDYYPPAGTKTVEITYEIYVSGIWSLGSSNQSSWENALLHFKPKVDNTYLTDRPLNYFGAHGFKEGLFSTTIVLTVDGSGNTADGNINNWTSAKTIKLDVAEYTNTGAFRLHLVNYMDGGGNVGHNKTGNVMPTVRIVAIA